MKRLLKVLAVALFTLTPLIISSSASAQAVCGIGFTGPDSNNLCTSIETFACSVTNANTVEIVNSNDQVVASGTVGNSDNGGGGSSTSGSVTNNSGTTFLVTITNPGLAGTCVAAAVVTPTEPVTPTDPVTPVPNPSLVQPSANGLVEALPITSNGFTQTVLVVIAGSLAALAVLGVSGVALYRYYKSL